MNKNSQITIDTLITDLSAYNLYIVVLFVLIPLVSYGYGRIARGEKAIETGHKYVYSLLVYAAMVPGMFALVLTAYVLFIERGSLLKVNVLIYFLPIISMCASVFILRKNVDFTKVPGFDRLYGLIIVLAVSFFISLGIIKTRIWIFFGSSIMTLFITAIIMFALLQVGLRKIFKPKSALDKLE